MKKQIKKATKKAVFKVTGRWRFLSFFMGNEEMTATLFAHGGFLHDRGWFEAQKLKRSVDLNGNPLPWFTYGMIDLMDDRLNKDLNVFEFGSGNSTMYLASRVNKVTSVESSSEWFDIVSAKIPSNAEILLRQDDSGYIKAINESGEKYDIIIIDGKSREECAKLVFDHLSVNGVVIVDDTERKPERSIVEMGISKGYKSLNFFGVSPGWYYEKCTSILYKRENCFNI